MPLRPPVITSVAASILLVLSASAQTLTLAAPHARLVQEVDETRTVTLVGNVHPLVAMANSSTEVDGALPMERMILHLKVDTTQETQLAQLIAQQNDPKSPLFHKYLTPKDYGTYFGVADGDIAKVSAWLTSHGFTIDNIPASKRSIVFSGTAAQVTRAFGTEIRSYLVAGVKHVANASDPQIPAALEGVVGGIVQLHDFQAGHNTTKLTPLPPALFAHPQYNIGTGHYLAPADFAAIYDVNALYKAGLYGAGQSIAIVSRSDASLTDVEKFRTTFGLPANDPQNIIVDVDPGFRYDGNGIETDLDTEWAGAIAPQATIKVIAGNCTNTSDGVVASEMYAVNNNVAPIISVSYGLCEASIGSSGAAFYNALWQQAAAQGQTVLVSSGDTGAAGCNSQGDSSASTAGVNGLCSSPYATCVGGTEFVEGSNAGQYWYPGNNASSGASAISYIPETVWNESGANGGTGIIGGGGGASIMYAKPSWQAGLGVPADGHRDVPDIALTSAEHDGYALYNSWAGGLLTAGGTSFATPSFAGIVALLNQKAGGAQGLLNPTLYALAAKQNAGGSAVFHDITTGNNSVPGLIGFSATAGYDLASGLGSVDANMLVTHWADASPKLTLTTSAGTLAMNSGQSTSVTLTTEVSSLNAATALTVSGLPTGVTGTFSPSSIAAPGSGKSALTISGALTAKAGSYNVVITAIGGGQTATLSLPLVISVPTFVITPSTTNLILNKAATAPVTITVTAQTGFNSALTLTLSGAPSGVTSVLSKTAVAAPGTGALTLSTAVAATAAPGKYPLVITGQGGGQTQTVTVWLTIPTFTVTTSSSYYSTQPGGTVTFPITVTPQTGFGSAIALAPQAGYLPQGVTTSFSPASVPGSAPATSTVTMTVPKTLSNGAYPFFINGTGGGITQGDYLTLLVGWTGSCSLYVDTTVPINGTVGPNILAIAGQTVTATEMCMWPQGSFSAPLSVTYSGIPSGVTVTPSGPLYGNENPITLSIVVPQTLAAGTYNMTATASAAGGFSSVSYFSIVVTANSFTAKPSATSVTVAPNSSAPLSVTTAHQGVFNSAISLAWSSLPSGVTATLAKASLSAPGDGTVATTFAASSSATPGTYTATLTAAGGGITQSVPVTIVVPIPSCTLAATTAKLTLFAGQTGTVQAACTNMVGTFSTPLKLSLTGAPSGVTLQSAATTLAGGGTGSIQFTTPISMAASTFTLSLTATSGSFTATVPVAVTVTPSNFTLTAAPASVSIPTGGTGPFSASSARSGLFNSAISLVWSGLPTGITATLTKSSLAAPGDGTIVTTFTVAASVAPGTYNGTLTASGGGDVQTLAVTLVVTPPSCTLGVTSSLLAIYSGQTGTVAASCSAMQGTFSNALSYSVSGAPSGVTAQYANGNIQVVTPLTMAAAKFTLTLTASSGSFSKSATVSVTVSASNFVLTPTTAAVSVQAGTSTTLRLTSAHQGVFASPVALVWSGLPTGVTAALSSATLAAPGDGTITTTFAASSGAIPGTYTATLTATGGGVTQSAIISLTVVALPSFNLTSSSIALTAGQSGTSQIAVTAQGTFSGTVTLSVSGLASGVTAKLASTSTAAGKAIVLTVSAGANAAGNFNLTVMGASGSLTKTLTIPVTVSALH